MGKNKEESKGPVFEVRLNNIRVSTFRNKNESGEWFNTVITRRFRDGEEWRDSNSFNGLADLALIVEGARLAREYISAHELQIVRD